MLRTDMLKKHNLFEILRAIRIDKVTTKPQLSKKTGLAPTSVHNLVNELVQKGLVTEKAGSVTSGGRKASQYSINNSRFFIVGVDIGTEATTAIVFDLAFNKIRDKKVNFRLVDHSVEEGINFVIILIKSLIGETRLNKSEILGVGISMPGLVDSERGVIVKIVYAPNWNNVPIKNVLEDNLGLSVFIDNDSNNSALYLKLQNELSENIVYISTTYGIGAGIIINNQLCRGAHHASGEIGHISINVEGDKCKCGNIGCIELLAADYPIIEKVKKKLGSKHGTIILEMCNGIIDNVTMDIISLAAKNNDAYAKDILSNAARYLGITINNIIKAYDPSQIILSSSWLGQFPEIFDQFKNNIYNINNFIRRDTVEIILNEEEDIFVKGGAALVLDFNFNEYNDGILLN